MNNFGEILSIIGLVAGGVASILFFIVERTRYGDKITDFLKELGWENNTASNTGDSESVKSFYLARLKKKQKESSDNNIVLAVRAENRISINDNRIGFITVATEDLKANEKELLGSLMETIKSIEEKTEQYNAKKVIFKKKKLFIENEIKAANEIIRMLLRIQKFSCCYNDVHCYNLKDEDIHIASASKIDAPKSDN